MTTRKRTVVMILATVGLLLGLEVRVALQVMLRIVGRDVGAGIIDTSVPGVCGGI